MQCPCLSGLAYDECCGRLHRGEARAATAAQLMRSRFSAFAVGDADYLLASWHPSTRPSTLTLDDDTRWYRLDIHETIGGGPLDARGQVRFTAHYRSPDGAGQLDEHSVFTRVDGSWLYVEPL
ncbi:MAG: YchJ family protein [Microcella sp.]